MDKLTNLMAIFNSYKVVPPGMFVGLDSPHD